MNRNSYVEIEIGIKIPMLKLKPKSEFRFQHRNQNFGKSKHRNSDEIILKFCQNFDFVECKKRTFVETLNRGQSSTVSTEGINITSRCSQ
jgi:hypothetical protein